MKKRCVSYARSNSIASYWKTIDFQSRSKQEFLCSESKPASIIYRRMCSFIADDVHNFWFDPNREVNDHFKVWFRGGPEMDSLIKERFGAMITAACSGELSDWECGDDPKKAVAFIILVDQFCRNMYRGSSEAFAYDAKALAVATKLVDSGKHKLLGPLERMFLYLPFEHNETRESQEKSVKLYEELLNEYGSDEAYRDQLKFTLQFAKDHRDVIEKYGRFPSRNKVLGRENTSQEEEDLKNWTYGF